MKVKDKLLNLFILLAGIFGFMQENDSLVYKKKVLDAIEVSILGSFYNQEGIHSAVGGGIGTESLKDFSPNIMVNVPIGNDGVLNASIGLSAYSSASSSNINPFDGAINVSESSSGSTTTIKQRASPWIESSGPSGKDVRTHGEIGYTHSSNDRNRIWNINGSVSTEYDYTSIGFGVGYTMLFNKKNTEIGINGQIFLDKWKPIYPKELNSYYEVNGNLNDGFFYGITITSENAVVESSTKYNPTQFTYVNDDSRNTYVASLSFSQILTQNLQISVFTDFIYMKGLLATPYQRVYFADKNDYFIEDFQLADDREKLPDTRIKYPIGIRTNYYINDLFTLRTYYRFYTDNWGLTAHTFSAELPVKLANSFTIYPMYRYYNQMAIDYFYPHETALSTYQFYTSDYDLSTFNSNQYGAGIKMAPPLGIFRNKNSEGKFRFKSLEVRYNHYLRSDNLVSNIISFGMDFTF